MDHHGKCPSCGSDWDGGDVVETYKRYRDEGKAPWAYYTDADILRHAEYHNWTAEKPTRFSRLVGLEFPDKYDGVWEYACPDCDARFPRFKEAKRDR